VVWSSGSRCWSGGGRSRASACSAMRSVLGFGLCGCGGLCSLCTGTFLTVELFAVLADFLADAAYEPVGYLLDRGLLACVVPSGRQLGLADQDEPTFVVSRPYCMRYQGVHILAQYQSEHLQLVIGEHGEPNGDGGVVAG
jgi:hypothetical protein